MKAFAFAIVILLLFLCDEVCAQPCLPQGITFSSQEQVDAFKTNFPGCSEIEGDVLVQGNDITNLDSLHILKVIGGYL